MPLGGLGSLLSELNCISEELLDLTGRLLMLLLLLMLDLLHLMQQVYPCVLIEAVFLHMPLSISLLGPLLLKVCVIDGRESEG